ncbi:MAG: tripartite tricarboxylate transporter substrate binding protein [Xanthobacteraceae bacterium]|nr:tripartite tricarboxylate transporter substrate binding protein [Xanthobacteraceae bacterium]
MTFPRRQFLRLAAGAATAPAVTRMARAQAYPTRPVRLIVGFPAGGVGDVLARLVGQWLSDRLGQPVVVENRPGAATNIATEAVARSAPDGHTLLWITAANAINASLYEKLGFNFIRDIVPVASLVRAPGVMEVNPAVPAKTIPEFIAYAKANPGKINLASSGLGTVSHVAGELFKLMAGVDMVHVPYRGAAPALTDLISGQVQVMILPITSSIEHIKAGRLRALAVTTATRLDVVPDVPTVAEFLPGYDVSDWTGIGVPRGTPAEVVDRLNKEISAALDDPKIKARFAELGSQLIPMSRADFGKLIADETVKWAKVVKSAGLKAE